ncbi:MAG: hypothetical protein GF421_04480 [Candidatus Aminicenantes bacterium]|nr:hypothetical protein [Candidatus Aminicenantes bacterium]
MKAKSASKSTPPLSPTAQIVLGGLSLCFFYLFLSGFFFSLFSTHRMYGLPLMLHLIVGLLFALFLCAFLILYSDNFSSFCFQNLFFWLFALSGLSLVVTSLLMMLPVFVYQTQKALFEIHRYSALISVLISVLFLYTAFLENESK